MDRDEFKENEVNTHDEEVLVLNSMYNLIPLDKYVSEVQIGIKVFFKGPDTFEIDSVKVDAWTSNTQIVENSGLPVKINTVGVPGDRHVDLENAELALDGSTVKFIGGYYLEYQDGESLPPIPLEGVVMFKSNSENAETVILPTPPMPVPEVPIPFVCNNKYYASTSYSFGSATKYSQIDASTGALSYILSEESDDVRLNMQIVFEKTDDIVIDHVDFDVELSDVVTGQQYGRLSKNEPTSHHINTFNANKKRDFRMARLHLEQGENLLEFKDGYLEDKRRGTITSLKNLILFSAKKPQG